MGFAATIEVYNVSPRANAIREYRFWTKDEHDKWTMMESERYELSFNDGKEPRVFNHTPITLAPYSGIEVSIEAFTPLPKLNQVKVEIEDLFGKRYKLELSMEK